MTDANSGNPAVGGSCTRRRWLRDLAAAAACLPVILRRPPLLADRPESLQRMRPFLGRNRNRIVAARLHAYAPDRLPPFGTRELDRLWSTAADFGIAMQIHFEPRYAEALDHYVRKYPSTRIIIDHLGRPMQGTPEEHAVVMKWSELPHTIMKLSAIPSRDNYPPPRCLTDHQVG